MSRSSLGRLGLALVSLLGLMSLYSASAFASGPPIVTAGAVTNKTLHTAVTNGTVEANGGSGTKYKIEYGKTKLYGQSTAYVTGSGAVSKLLYGLEPLTTYHYRISATNSLGTTVSEDVIFEMLLSWKVEGKYLSEALVPEWPEYTEVLFGTDTTQGPTTFTAEGKIGATNTKVACEYEKGKGYVGNALGSKYNFSFPICKTYLNGVENKTCAPATPLVVNLNSNMVPAAGTKISMSELCSIGEGFPLTGSGFEVGALTEGKEVPVTLTEQLSLFNMKVSISNPAWLLIGPWVGKKFGIS
jgi:hypothetical protein